MPAVEGFPHSPGHVYPESDFTRPRPDCPHPEWWHAHDPQSTEVEVSHMLAGLVVGTQPEYVVETGTCMGVTAMAMGQSLSFNGHGHMHTIEYNEKRAKWVQAEVEQRALPVTVVHGSSLDFEPPQPIDFLFLDSETHLRVPEFHHFKPHLTPGAVVAFHDTAPHKGQYGDDVRAIPGLRYLQLRTPRGITIGQWEE